MFRDGGVRRKLPLGFLRGATTGGIAAGGEDQLRDQQVREGLDRVDLRASPDGQPAQVLVTAGLGDRVQDLAGESAAVLEREGLEAVGSSSSAAGVVLPPAVARLLRRRRRRRREGRREQQNVNVGVRQALEALQGELSEGRQHRRGEEVVEVVGGQLGSDVSEDERADGGGSRSSGRRRFGRRRTNGSTRRRHRHLGTQDVSQGASGLEARPASGIGDLPFRFLRGFVRPFRSGLRLRRDFAL
mmetsp:Transcript_18603/g.43003  ORF Transcript_18603/g.43003 Transcript_18603/m.43003 type:complete len:244 (+) Transcript_18603:1580-2311(+)